MATPKTVEWLKKATTQLYEVAGYIQDEFGQRAAHKFIIKAFQRSEFVARHPEIGRRSRRYKTVRFVLLGKHHRMYYRVEGAKLFIAQLFDTRQDPKKDAYR